MLTTLLGYQQQWCTTRASLYRSMMGVSIILAASSTWPVDASPDLPRAHCSFPARATSGVQRCYYSLVTFPIIQQPSWYQARIQQRFQRLTGDDFSGSMLSTWGTSGRPWRILSREWFNSWLDHTPRRPCESAVLWETSLILLSTLTTGCVRGLRPLKTHLNAKARRMAFNPR